MTKLKIQIKTIAGELFFEYEKEGNTIKDTVHEMLKAFKGKIITGVDLSGQDLSGVEFDNSKFDNSKFDNSKFDNSKFYNSKFYNSKFDNSKFYNSTFYNSKFYNSTFYNSKFYNSKFYNSKFYNSTFDAVSVESAYLCGGLDSVKADLWLVLLPLKAEIPALKQSILEGKIDGSTYTGSCACLMGTIGNNCGKAYTDLGIKPNSQRPIEKWFMAFKPGHTPENHPMINLTYRWIEELEYHLAKTTETE